MTTPARIVVWMLIIGQVLTGLTLNLLLERNRDQQTEIAFLVETVTTLVETDTVLADASALNSEAISRNSESIELLAVTIGSMVEWLTDLQKIVLDQP